MKTTGYHSLRDRKSAALCNKCRKYSTITIGLSSTAHAGVYFTAGAGMERVSPPGDKVAGLHNGAP